MDAGPPPISVPALDPASAKVRDAIWAKELTIYRERGNGNFNYYIQNTLPDYLGWPPTVGKPQRSDGLANTRARLARDSKEVLSMELVDFALHGDNAVIYYKTHRTRRPDGSATNEVFENIHVWLRDGADWKLFGAMSRAAPLRP